ncbi:MAG: zinc-ribbon domain-containing protein, partial [Bacilli bacterium]|nr:zinc-ribbon domain-containing protein [Bacilli bacterium]
MYCRKCGKYIPDDVNVCPYCGVEVITTNNYPVYNKTNTMAIVGLITAFLSPLLGWIFGGIGLKRANNGYGGKAVAIVALIIATANFAYSMYMFYSG